MALQANQTINNNGTNQSVILTSASKAFIETEAGYIRQPLT
jgi:hypothetical protein